MTLSIIYVNYNTRGLLKQSLKHLFWISPALDFEVIVVDNNSSDDSAEIVKDLFPFVKLIKTKKNLGYSGGANLGLKEARGEYVCIFNADIFISKGSLENIVNYLDNNQETALVGPKLTNADGSLQYSCYRFPNWYTPILRRTFLGKLNFGKKKLAGYLMKNFSHSETKEVNWLLGGALIARKSALKKVGNFDSRFFLYFEDTDLAHKFKKAGYKVVYLPQATFIHLHRRESADMPIIAGLFSKMTQVHIKSAFKYFWKYRGIKA